MIQKLLIIPVLAGAVLVQLSQPAPADKIPQCSAVYAKFKKHPSWKAYAENKKDGRRNHVCGWGAQYQTKAGAIKRALTECRNAERAYKSYGIKGTCHIVSVK
jgi:hypothetical protein